MWKDTLWIRILRIPVSVQSAKCENGLANGCLLNGRFFFSWLVMRPLFNKVKWVTMSLLQRPCSGSSGEMKTNASRTWMATVVANPGWSLAFTNASFFCGFLWLTLYPWQQVSTTTSSTSLCCCCLHLGAQQLNGMRNLTSNTVRWISFKQVFVRLLRSGLSKIDHLPWLFITVIHHHKASATDSSRVHINNTHT